MEITLVTGNKNKLKEFDAIFDGDKIDLKNEKIDLDEIQSMKLEEICEHKVRQAYEIVKKPVIVEDTGMFLDDLGGLPGPFIKFFNELLGNGALIRLLGDSKNRVARAKTCIAYFDGNNFVRSLSEVKGTVTHKLKEGDGFGFDFSFIPDGYDKTFSELGLEVKNKISHRACAIKQFKEDFAEIFGK